MATLEQIQAQIAKLQLRADKLVAKQSSTVIAKIRDIMEKHGITAADIDEYVNAKNGMKGQRRTAAKQTSALNASTAKYRDPKTGATWSGHGRAPGWIAAAKDRTRFLVDGASEVTKSSTAAPTKRAGNYRRGPQPAKYRDPKSDATWSGRGRAPAWLAGKKNLDAFLIAEAPDAVEPVAAPAKKAAKKTSNVASKKVVAEKVTAKRAATKKEAATVAKAPAKKTAAKKVAAKKSPGAKKAAAKKVAVKNAPASAEPAASTDIATNEPAFTRA